MRLRSWVMMLTAVLQITGVQVARAQSSPAVPRAIDQLFGMHLTVVQILGSQRPLDSAADVQDYLSRLRAMPVLFSELSATLAHDARRGVVPPKVALHATLQSIAWLSDDTWRTRPEQHPLLLGLHHESRRQDFVLAARPEARTLLLTRVLPAYQDLATVLRSLGPRVQVY